MVTCPYCEGRLPYQCTCPIPPYKKLQRYRLLSQRELLLLEAMMKDNFKPKIKLVFDYGDEIVYPDVIDWKNDFYVLLWKKVKITRECDFEKAVLLDVKGKELYHHTFNIHLHEDDSVELSWYLGV
jgi:hypothetical protein